MTYVCTCIIEQLPFGELRFGRSKSKKYAWMAYNWLFDNTSDICKDTSCHVIGCIMNHKMYIYIEDTCHLTGQIIIRSRPPTYKCRTHNILYQFLSDQKIRIRLSHDCRFNNTCKIKITIKCIHRGHMPSYWLAKYYTCKMKTTNI